MNPLSALIEPATKLLDKFIPDQDTKIKLAHELATMAEKHAQEIAKGQIEINKQEAAHRSIFIAGWRPFIGWTCGTALAWHFVVYPFLAVWFDLKMIEFDMSSLMTVLMGMLGLGGMRTFEKVKGKAK